MKNNHNLLLPVAVATLLAACGGSSSSTTEPPQPEPQQLQPGGAISGLNGSVSLQLSIDGVGVETKSFSAADVDTDFRFDSQIDEGSDFAITVATQPTNQQCQISNNSGQLNDSTVTATAVTCEGVMMTGVLRDSPVGGIHFVADQQQGTTNAAGEFQYRFGDGVQFSVGGITLPQVAAAELMTPAHFSDQAEVQTNILQLLQTLDNDGDPDNGIWITEALSQSLAEASADVTAANFDSDFAAELDSAETGLQLVSEEQALAHFERAQQALLQGAWLFEEGEGKRNVLVFYDYESYMLIHEHNDDHDQVAGSVEFGGYQWQASSGEVTLMLNGESDSSGGLFDQGQTDVTHLQVGLDSLTMQFGEEESVEFRRVQDDEDPLVGAWFLYELEDDNENLIIFLSDEEYAVIHSANQEQYDGSASQPLSGEFGTLSNNHDTGVLTFNMPHVDSDGPGGLYDADIGPVSFTASLLPWGDLQMDGGEDDRFQLVRVDQFIAPQQHQPDGDDQVQLGDVIAQREMFEFFLDFDDLPLGSYQLPVAFDADPEHCQAWFGSADCDVTVQLSLDSYPTESQPGSGTVVSIYSGNLYPATWYVNSAGTAVMEFAEQSQLTLAPLTGKDAFGNKKVLLGLQKGDLQSQWQTLLIPNQI